MNNFEVYENKTVTYKSTGGLNVTVEPQNKYAVARRLPDGGLGIIAQIPDGLENPYEMAKTIVDALHKAGFRSE